MSNSEHGDKTDHETLAEKFNKAPDQEAVRTLMNGRKLPIEVKALLNPQQRSLVDAEERAIDEVQVDLALEGDDSDNAGQRSTVNPAGFDEEEAHSNASGRRLGPTLKDWRERREIKDDKPESRNAPKPPGSR